MEVIPFAKNKDTFQLRESSCELPIVKWLVLAIQAILRSIIPEALTRSNMILFLANGITPRRVLRDDLQDGERE